MSILSKRTTDGYNEIVDDRTGEVIARFPIDKDKIKSSADRYEASVKARKERLAKQKCLDAQLFAHIWNEPTSYL